MRRLSLLILISTAWSVVAEEPGAGDVAHLKIRPQVLVRGEAATLGDVLVFPGGDDQLRAAIGDLPVVSPPDDAATTAVTYDQIERRLHELGVDLTRVLIGGATTCRITRRPAAPPPDGGPAGTVSGLLRRPLAPRGGAPVRRLAQVLREYVNRDLAKLGGTAEIDFEQASQQLLELTTPPWEFSIQARGRGRLGLRTFRVVIRREGRTQRTADVYARVRLSQDVLVAREPLGIGTSIERDDVELETRLFDSEKDIGFDRVEQIIGQQVAKFVPAGQMIRRSDVKVVDLVRRSRPVTIVGAARNVHVRLTGVALDSGGYGESVRVRIGETRKQRRVLRGIVTGLGTVSVREEGS